MTGKQHISTNKLPVTGNRNVTSTLYNCKLPCLPEKQLSFAVMNAPGAFELLLFYKGRPSYYTLWQEGDLYIGEPVRHHFYERHQFPCFIVRSIQNIPVVEGIDDTRMIADIQKAFQSIR